MERKIKSEEWREGRYSYMRTIRVQCVLRIVMHVLCTCDCTCTCDCICNCMCTCDMHLPWGHIIRVSTFTTGAKPQEEDNLLLEEVKWQEGL